MKEHFKRDVAKTMISSLFKDDETLYLSIDRHEHYECNASNVLELLNNVYDVKNMILTDVDCTRMIEFSSIGSARTGKS